MTKNHCYRPIVYLEPGLIVDYSAWNGLIPFAFWLIDALRPRVLVELGTESGVSYCAFCQAVSHLKLSTACYAVDTWQGDQHTGPYGEEVFGKLSNYHEPRYGSFSRLLRIPFDKGVEHFSDSSIDLLHIDGYHTYEAVKHDFDTWLPKLSERGVIVFHDINVHEMNFGVWRLWEEIKQQYPSFSLLHSHGLGVLAVGSDRSEAIHWLTEVESLDPANTSIVRTFFARLGLALVAGVEKKRLSEQLKALQARVDEGENQIVALQNTVAERDEAIRRVSLQLGEREVGIAALQNVVAERDEAIRRVSLQLGEREVGIAALQNTVAALVNSTSWRITRPLRVAKRLVLEPSNTTKLILARAVRKAITDRAAEKSVQPDPLSDLLYTIESLRVNRSSFYGFGWVFHKRQNISAVKLIVRGNDGDHIFNVSYGKHREDVSKVHSFLGAENSGFRVSGSLPYKGVFEFLLRIECEQPISNPIHIPLTPEINVDAVLPSEEIENMLYSIDSLKIRRHRFYCCGWVFHKDIEISAVKLIVRTKNNSYEFNMSYGGSRPDVARVQPFPNARNSGFLATGLLPSEEFSGFLLRIEFQKAAKEAIHINLTPEIADGKKPGSPLTLSNLLEILDARQLHVPEIAHYSENPRNAEMQEFIDAAENSSRSDRKFTLIIDHNLGGGANQYREAVMKDLREKNRPVLLLYFDLARLQYVLDCVNAQTTLRVDLDSPRELLSLVKRINLEEIVLNNAYSFEAPLEIATLLPELKKASGASLKIAMHDFLPVCPSLHLLDDGGKFCGVPDLSRCQQCLPNNKGDFTFLIGQREIESWRNLWGACLDEANSILCFSDSSAALVQRAYPKIDQKKFDVQPHRVGYVFPRKPLVDIQGVLNIGVVGSINTAKGAGVIENLANCIKRRGLSTRISVIGTVDRNLDHDFVTVTGPYERQNLPDLIEMHRINIFLLPSIVPETFSYVTEELMMLDVPLAVFPLGAPAERVPMYAKGLVLKEMGTDETLDALIAFHERLRHEAEDSNERKDAERRATIRDEKTFPKVHAFTCAAVNYLPKVRLLCQSIKKYHPEMMVHVALADRIPGWLDLSQEPFDDVVSIESLDIPDRKSWIFWHNVVELCTAMKPFVLRSLLDLPNCEAVYYFDPDIVLFSRLDDMTSALDDSSIILTPHLTSPENTIDAIRDNEICSLKHGIYNLGFIGVRNVEQGRLFAKWWSDRLYYFCQEEIDQGLFTDQRWIDFAPVFFEGVRIIKSSRFNVAPWNLSTRKIEGSFERGFKVDGQPLGFYHFTGFDSGDHKKMAEKYANGNYAVTSLIDWYEKCTQNGSREKNRDMPWVYSLFSNEEPITKNHRLIYRLREDLQAAFPDPFEVRSDKNSYFHWFKNHALSEHPELISHAKAAG